MKIEPRLILNFDQSSFLFTLVFFVDFSSASAFPSLELFSFPDLDVLSSELSGVFGIKWFSSMLNKVYLTKICVLVTKVARLPMKYKQFIVSRDFLHCLYITYFSFS